MFWEKYEEFFNKRGAPRHLEGAFYQYLLVTYSEGVPADADFDLVWRAFLAEGTSKA